MQHTLIVATYPGFDVNVSSAGQSMRLGHCHGFQHVGVQSLLVGREKLLSAPERVPGPIFWLTYGDYSDMDEATVRMLSRYPHFVHVNTWFEGMEALHARYGAPGPGISEDTLRRILRSEPDFVWCSTPEPYLEFYDGWRRAGMKVVSLPWACDTDRYHPVAGLQFRAVDVAFVGGYRVYKEPQYAAYLWPYEDRLKVWGYTAWPRCYQGYLPIEDEKALYSQARLCPTLSEPQFVVTGDMVERPFKIMGCGGLTILDTPSHRELFSDDEALMPASVEEYHQMARAILEDDGPYIRYRQAGYAAVLERHTYAHRARQIMEELGL